MVVKKEDALEVRILQDQLADLRAGLFVSMPISAVLSGLILTVQAVSGGGFAAAIWFLVVNAINAARLALARYQRKETGRQDDLTGVSQRLRWFGILAFLAGIAWSFLAVLTVGYTTPQAPLHLVILAGISAGAVTYGSAYAAVATNFITPPLLITAGCLSAKGNFEDYILAFAVLLFLGGLVRSSFVGQARFREASRLRHEAERLAAEMERNSRQDHLTGLLNRRGLAHAIDQLENTDGPFVAMLIDLDGFKSVNDTYGHRTGDELLAMIARRIEEEAPAGSTLARIGVECATYVTVPECILSLARGRRHQQRYQQHFSVDWCDSNILKCEEIYAQVCRKHTCFALATIPRAHLALAGGFVIGISEMCQKGVQHAVLACILLLPSLDEKVPGPRLFRDEGRSLHCQLYGFRGKLVEQLRQRLLHSRVCRLFVRLEILKCFFKAAPRVEITNPLASEH
jgi:GGDEF domain-containing protein